MTVEEYLKSTFDKLPTTTATRYYDFGAVRPRVVCKDGFSVSVQGGARGFYCKPRSYCNEYLEVELGYPSEPMPSLEKYAEDKERPTDTVYAYVPIGEVEKLIEEHGGIDEDLTKDMIYKTRTKNEMPIPCL